MSAQCGTCSQWEGDWKKENSFETESGDEKQEGRCQRREQSRVQGTGSTKPRTGPRVPSVVPCLHTEKISYNFTAPLSAAIERGQIPSWFLTLCPVRVVAIMGKSKPLASAVGYLSLPALQPQSKQQPRVMSVKSVCA